MIQIGVQTRNVVNDADPVAGFQLLKETGFSCADFSLNSYPVSSLKVKGKRTGFLRKFFSGVCPEWLKISLPSLIF